jgi:hypothetical protein
MKRDNRKNEQFNECKYLLAPPLSEVHLYQSRRSLDPKAQLLAHPRGHDMARDILGELGYQQY